jgi:hypothetical protein
MGVVDTCGKFATGINDTSETGGKICRQVSLISVANLPPVWLIRAAILLLVSLTPVENLPLVLLILVVNLELRISPSEFSKKI